MTDVIGTEQVAKATALLQRYKTGKAALDKRIVDNELWFRMQHWANYKNEMMEGKPKPSSGWLFNSIANKHADAMDNYPEPNVLPRAADDEQTAKVLSKILPVLLEQAEYEQVYSDTWWRKLKQGTGVKGIFWDPGLRNGVGDISIKSMDLLMMYWEPGVMDIQDSPHLFSLAVADNEQLKEISGNRDVSQGGTTSGLTAASAIAALQEAGSKLSRDMLKSAYRAFAKECYFIIDLMRQFYDESRVYRITGDSGQPEYVQFSGAMLQPQPGGMIGGVELGSHEPVFDITVSAAKKSTFSRLSQNETAKECYQMGLFAPANADAALAVLDMMDFEGIEKVRERVQQNGTLYTQLQQAMEQLQKLSAIIDQQNGTNMSAMAGAAAQAAGTTGGGSGGQTTAKTATNGLGAVVGGGGNSLATQAAKRAMNVNNPNK